MLLIMATLNNVGPSTIPLRPHPRLHGRAGQSPTVKGCATGWRDCAPAEPVPAATAQSKSGQGGQQYVQSPQERQQYVQTVYGIQQFGQPAYERQQSVQSTQVHQIGLDWDQAMRLAADKDLTQVDIEAINQAMFRPLS